MDPARFRILLPFSGKCQIWYHKSSTLKVLCNLKWRRSDKWRLNNIEGLILIVNQICKKLRRDFRTVIRKERKIKILTVWRFERPFQRDLFSSSPFSTFRETVVRAGWNPILVSSNGSSGESVKDAEIWQDFLYYYVILLEWRQNVFSK